MALPLTKEMISAAYTFLLTTPPFIRWKLPQAHELRFKVSGHLDRRGQCDFDGTSHTIVISRNCVGHTSNLIGTVAHEMLHVHLDRRGVKSAHGAEFKRLAALVCKYHGFDSKLF